MNNIQLQYQSVINTPNLWSSTSTFYNLEQYIIPQKKISKITHENLDKNLRLGHKVEYFINHFLSNECGNKLLLKTLKLIPPLKRLLVKLMLYLELEKKFFI